MKEKADKNMKVYLRYNFTPDEKTEITKTLVENINRKKQLEDDLKTTKSQFKHRIDSVDAEINKDTQRLSTGHEMRDIECEVFYDWEKDERTVIRTDTGEEVEKKRIPEEDRQMRIDEQEEEKEADPGVAPNEETD